MRRTLSAMLILFVANVPAAAQVPVVAGPGITTCAQFAEYYRRNSVNAEIAYFAWAQGFMSAVNLPKRIRNEPTRNLMGIPTASQKQHLRGFCDQRPLSEFVHAVMSLYESLPENPLKSQ